MIGHYPDDELRRKRIRRVKKLLRPMPRRTNLHKYPILKYFASYARKCTYLWEFKQSGVSRAIYLGWFITLIPMYGLQMITAFIICFFIRANALVAMLLQLITNPITIPIILYTQYVLGEYIYEKLFNIDLKVGANVIENLKTNGFEALIASLQDWQLIKHISISMGIGGVILSLIGAFITNTIYKYYLSKK